jgi:hypothetical protein
MWRPPGAFDAQLGLLGYHFEGGADEVGELGALQPRPQALDRVEFGRVGGQAFHDQPVPLGVQPGLHGAAAVGRQAVP